jgi:hypothetical protein
MDGAAQGASSTSSFAILLGVTRIGLLSTGRSLSTAREWFSHSSAFNGALLICIN